MNKQSFIKSVRSWDSSAVKKALKVEPSLAEFADDNGMAPLHHCARTNGSKSGLKVADSVKTARALISHGADPNRLRIVMDGGDEFRATPLWFAVAWGKNPMLARFLLENGAVADSNAVWSAIWDQDLEIAELLTSYGGNVDVVIDGQTPLLATVKSRRLKLLIWLIAKGANVNFQDRAGYTALHHAVMKNLSQTEIEDLLGCGAGPNIKARDGSSPASRALSPGKKKLALLFKDR